MSKAKKTEIPCPASIYDRIADVIRNAEETAQSYFWTPHASARERRRAEERRTVPMIAWTENSDVYTAEFHFRESCSHVYAHGIYTRNFKKTTLKAVKASFARLERVSDDEYRDYVKLMGVENI